MFCTTGARIGLGSVLLFVITCPLSVRAQRDGERNHPCRARCHEAAKAALNECREAGDDVDRCRYRAKRVFEKCIAENCTEQDECEGRCRRAAGMLLDECLNAGDPPEECERRAGERLHNCVTEECGRPPVCQRRCRFTAHRVLRRCLAEGGDRETCTAQAREMFRSCVDRCGRICGGVAGLTCDEGEFCKMPPGSCNVADAFGACWVIPDGCPDVWEPVCGCDGVTYGNACEADAVSIAIRQRGECLVECDPTVATGCEDGQFCRKLPGQCDDDDAPGACVVQLEACPEIFRPVCGCDGLTYGNPCEADQAGVSVAHGGECRVTCVAGGEACPDGEFCRQPIGVCGDPNSEGICEPVPLDCPLRQELVCGCDGVTYENRCEAARAGASVLHPGECS